MTIIHIWFYSDGAVSMEVYDEYESVGFSHTVQENFDRRDWGNFIRLFWVLGRNFRLQIHDRVNG